MRRTKTTPILVLAAALAAHVLILCSAPALQGSPFFFDSEVISGTGCDFFALYVAGDNLRHGLNADLGFSPADRQENIRRVGETAKILMEAGLVAITAFISPYRRDRDAVRALTAPGDFIEIFLDCSLDACRRRDPKGLYKKADAGEIPEFTGVSAPYEPPLQPELRLRTDGLSETGAVEQIIACLRRLKVIPE